ncbi:MAG: efflux RND transporter periplasmic adaptor subunit [Candidatus Cloacimonetes bacterium]|nr:efflux RND transporter periplasmic adaptor subunit [Candidatus Cloacimonadota bacterium]
MRKKWKIVIIVVAVLVLLFLGLQQCGKAALKKAAALAPSQTHTVARGEIVSQVEITGEVQPETVVAIKSKVSGKVVKFYADENDYVKSGAIIADIEPDYNQANTLFSTKAQLSRAELRLANARKDLKDKDTLLAKGYISQEVHDAARDELTSAGIEFRQAQSQYDAIKDMDVPGKVIHVYASASGMVIERTVNEGEMVQSSLTSFGEGTVVMKIADLSRMVVKSNINEVDIAKFSLGQEARIKLDALPYQDFAGSIVKIAPSAITENNAKVFPVEISINASGETVKPGMTAAVTIIGESRADVLVIPIRAVFTDDKNQDIVYVLSPEDKKDKENEPAAPRQPLPTPVTLGANDLQNVEVISGLKEGDEISLTEPLGQQNSMQMMMR